MTRGYGPLRAIRISRFDPLYEINSVRAIWRSALPGLLEMRSCILQSSTRQTTRPYQMTR